MFLLAGTFRFRPNSDLYTDGSAIFVAYPGLARAACAIVQFDAGDLLVLRCPLPRSWPQNAPASEHLAFELNLDFSIEFISFAQRKFLGFRNRFEFEKRRILTSSQ